MRADYSTIVEQWQTPDSPFGRRVHCAGPFARSRPGVPRNLMTTSRTRSSRARTRKPRSAEATPHGFQAVARLDQVRVLAHPLRLRLLEIFAAQAATTKQVA